VAILVVLAILIVAFLVASWSCARSYFEKGRLRGIREATNEIIRGLELHYAAVGSIVPDDVIKAIDAASTITSSNFGRTKDPYQARLWIFGDAAGQACWRKGYAAAAKELAPKEGQIRCDMSLNELSRLSWLAHLGFLHMMPNNRSFEIHRFNAEEDAREGEAAVSKLDAALPARDRPLGDLSVQAKIRRKLICDWWQKAPMRLTSASVAAAS
jgi:hypothetical protein